MIWLARVGVTLAAIFSLAMGLLFWADPMKAGAVLGLTSLNPLGTNSLRADLAAFFLVTFIACTLALLRGKAHWLYGSALVFGLAVFGRFIGIIVDGPPVGIAQPVIIELVLVAILIFGARQLSKPRV
jgi:predicted signal transduction protein with EAL and GGDEF domain|tara:strand:- start:254850 stop:255233 length:384 start_codon:yes stop_codon:yes gene_type:complete